MVESLDDLVKLVRKVTEFQKLQRCVDRVRSLFPKLNDWSNKNWQKLLVVESQVDELLAVTQFMIDNPRPDCFTRELPLSISTKLIERNRSLLSAWFDELLPEGAIDFGSTRSFEQRYGFRYSRQHLLLRFLDENMASELGCPWMELSLPAAEIARLPVVAANVFIVENKINLLTLPKSARGIALGGIGAGVTALFDIAWLSNQRLCYWGDLDMDGFHILARLRHRLPKTQSLFMDLETLEQHRSLATMITNRNTDDTNDPAELTESELAAYRICKTQNLRFEQEHIAQSTVNKWFEDNVGIRTMAAGTVTDSASIRPNLSS